MNISYFVQQRHLTRMNQIEISQYTGTRQFILKNCAVRGSIYNNSRRTSNRNSRDIFTVEYVPNSDCQVLPANLFLANGCKTETVNRAWTMIGNCLSVCLGSITLVSFKSVFRVAVCSFSHYHIARDFRNN